MEKGFYLKAYLLEQGIKISLEAKAILDAQSDIWLMDDAVTYVTNVGITLNFESQYVTAGINSESKYNLIAINGKLFISDGKDLKVETTVISPPDYMKDEMVIDGKKITVYVNTNMDRARLQLMIGCMNNCKFCNSPEYNYEFNSIKGLEEALQVALSQTDIKHLLVSSGSVKLSDLEKLTEMYDYFGKKYSHLNIDLMMTPRGFTSYTDSDQYENYLLHLKEIGIHGLSINIELNNPDYLKKFCPEKYAIGQDNYLKFIEQAVKVFGKDKVRSLLIVGLEPLEDTLKGVEKLAKIGCNPVLSPLFPYGEANTAPNAELFIAAKEQSEKICNKYNIKMGPLCKPCSHNVL